MRFLRDVAAAALTIFILVWIFALTLAVFAPKAHALDANLRAACTSDYLSLCFGTVPGSPSCRRCFVAHGPWLSTECRTAIRSSAEFGAQYRVAAYRYHQTHHR